MMWAMLKRTFGNRSSHHERGIETIEWIALAAVVLVLLGAMGVAFRSEGQAVGEAIVAKMIQWIGLWGAGSGPGGGVSPGVGPGGPAGQPPGPGGGGVPPGGGGAPAGGGVPPGGGGLPAGGGRVPPGGGGGGSPLTGPSTGVTRLVNSVVNPPSREPQWQWKVTSGGQLIYTPRPDRMYEQEYVYDRKSGKWEKGDWKRKKPEFVQLQGTIVQVTATKEGYIDPRLSFGSEDKDAFDKGKKDAYAAGGLGAYKLQGAASVTVGENGLSANFQGQAGVYAAKGEAAIRGDLLSGKGYKVAGELKGEAYLGAEAQGQAAVTFGKEGVKAGLGVEAFIGGKAEVSGALKTEIAGIKAGLTGKAGVSYGLGAKFNAEMGFEEGKIRFKLDVGATLGVGGNLSIGVDVDVLSIGKAIADAGKSAVDAGVRAWKWLWGG